MRNFEPAFRRIRAEHRVLRAMLTAADGDVDRVRGRRLARHLAFIEDHADYEDDVLYPFVRARVPAVARAWVVDRLAKASFRSCAIRWNTTLRAGRRYSGPLIEGLRHHFAEEEEDISAPALAAGLSVTPPGEPGHLVALHEELAALRAA